MGKRKNEVEVTTKSRKRLKLEQELAIVQAQLNETKARLDRAMRIIRKYEKLERLLPPYHHMVLRKGEDYDHNLEDWLVLLYSKIQPILTFSKNKNSVTALTLNILHSDIKKPIRSLIHLAFDIRKHGLRLLKNTFAKENLVVLRDEIIVKRLYVTKVGTNRSNEDFNAIRELILATFFKDKENDLPLDMLKLLDSLGKPPPYDELLILNHFALMNTRARRQFITQWYDIIEQYDDDEWNRYKTACSKLPHTQDWDTLIESFGPLQLVLDFTSYSTDATEQPRFFRHALEHLLNYCRMGKSQQPPLYVYDDCVDLVIATFADSICAFLDILSECKLLEIMGPQKFFD